MKLHLIDRYLLLRFLPAEGSFVILKTAETVRDKLLPSAEEVEAYELVEDQTGLHWKEGANLLARSDDPIEIELTGPEIRVCKFEKTFRKLDEEEKLLSYHIPLIELVAPGLYAELVAKLEAEPKEG